MTLAERYRELEKWAKKKMCCAKIGDICTRKGRVRAITEQKFSMGGSTMGAVLPNFSLMFIVLRVLEA